MRHPVIEVIDTNLGIGEFTHRLPAKQPWQSDVHGAQDGFRHGIGDKASLVGFLQVDIVLKLQRASEFGEHIEDLVERDLVKVGHGRWVAQRQRMHMLDRVGCFEAVTLAGAELDQVVGNQLTADEQRHREGRHANSFKKSMASFCTSCVAAQDILSSWPSFLSLKRWMVRSRARLVRPHGHRKSQSIVTSSPVMTPPQWLWLTTS